jgi:hypothetical protein
VHFTAGSGSGRAGQVVAVTAADRCDVTPKGVNPAPTIATISADLLRNGQLLGLRGTSMRPLQRRWERYRCKPHVAIRPSFVKRPRAQDHSGARYRRETRRCNTRAVICALLAWAMMACQRALPEPGTPPATRSPFFRELESFETVDQAAKVLPDRATWNIVFDLKSAPRDGCPRFDQLTFDVKATDLGYSGTLRLESFNDRLAKALFRRRMSRVTSARCVALELPSIRATACRQLRSSGPLRSMKMADRSLGGATKDLKHRSTRGSVDVVKLS